jgi:uncharacterized RDD family membrane protein YckC
MMAGARIRVLALGDDERIGALILGTIAIRVELRITYTQLQD